MRFRKALLSFVLVIIFLVAPLPSAKAAEYTFPGYDGYSLTVTLLPHATHYVYYEPKPHPPVVYAEISGECYGEYFMIKPNSGGNGGKMGDLRGQPNSKLIFRYYGDYSDYLDAIYLKSNRDVPVNVTITFHHGKN